MIPLSISSNETGTESVGSTCNVRFDPVDRLEETLSHYRHIIGALDAGKYDGLSSALRRRLLKRLRNDMRAVKDMIEEAG